MNDSVSDVGSLVFLNQLKFVENRRRYRIFTTVHKLQNILSSVHEPYIHILYADSTI